MPTSNLDLYIVSGNIVIFSGEHSEKFKNDILHSSLTGHLAADASSTDSDELWSTYTKTVADLSWVTCSLDQTNTRSSEESLYTISLQAYGDVLSENDRQTLDHAFSVLKEQPKDSPSILALTTRFNAHTTTSYQDNKKGDTSEKKTSTGILLTFINHEKTVHTLRITIESGQYLDIGILNNPVLDTTNKDDFNTWLLSSTFDESTYEDLRVDVDAYLDNSITAEIIRIQDSR